MGYFGNQNFNGNRRQNGGGYQQGNSYGVQGGSNKAQGQKSKRSGAKYGTDKHGKPYVSGWKVKNGRMYSFYARPSSKTSEHKGRSFTWEDWIFSLKIDDVPADIAGKPIGICLFCVETQKVVIKDMGYVMNPKAPNGGYTGRYGQK